MYIAPSVLFEVPGRMVDPVSALFWVSWQGDDRVIEDGDIRGADAAIEWGRERSDYVFIRLGHTGDTYFSAGAKHPAPPDETLRIWPPDGPPPDEWFTPEAES